MGSCNLCGHRCRDDRDYCKKCEQGIEETEDMMHPDEDDEEFWAHEDEDL